MVTLIHKEEWAAFSGTVRRCFATFSVLRSESGPTQDVFPDDNVVWGDFSFSGSLSSTG